MDIDYFDNFRLRDLRVTSRNTTQLLKKHEKSPAKASAYDELVGHNYWQYKTLRIAEDFNQAIPTTRRIDGLRSTLQTMCSKNSGSKANIYL